MSRAETGEPGSGAPPASMVMVASKSKSASIDATDAAAETGATCSANVMLRGLASMVGSTIEMTAKRTDPSACRVLTSTCAGTTTPSSRTSGVSLISPATKGRPNCSG